MNVHATAPQFLPQLAADLENLGMAVAEIDTAQQMVIGFAPMSAIPDLTTLPNFASVTPIYAPIAYAGPVATQGAALIKAPQFRAQQGVDGSGQTVGILSTSMNLLKGLPNDETTGALGLGQVRIIQEGPAGSDDEGRAMAQIVHAVAPGAFIDFYSGFFTPQDMANGIYYLKAAGASQIVDDIAYADEPMFNDGIIAQAVDQVVGKGAFYASATGNDGNGGFLTNWNGMTATVGGITGTFLDLGGGNPLQTFTLNVLNPNDPSTFINFLNLFTQWDNAYLEGGSFFPNYQVHTQINVYVTTADGSKILANVNDDTLNTNEALQNTTFINDGSFGTNQFALAFQLVQGPAPTMLRWVDFTDSGLDIHALHEGGPAVFGHAAAAGAVAVAAVPFSSPTTPEPFSSVGGSIPFLFDQWGNRLATPDIRFKPDVAGPDGVTTTLPADTGLNQFFGTSAAAPHVAAAAALLRDRYPFLTNVQVLQQLEATAIAVPPGTGRNNVTGFGLIQLSTLVSTTPGTGSPSGPSIGNGSPGGGIGSITNTAIWGESSTQATNLGVLGSGTETFQSVIKKQSDGLDGNQWGTWTAGISGTFSATLNYNIPGGDLNFRLYMLNSFDDLVQIAAGTLLDVSKQTLSAQVSAGERLYLWIYGYNHSEGNYTLGVSL
jgi:Subtilase family